MSSTCQGIRQDQLPSTKSAKTLFSGDIIYDGMLIDNAWHSDPRDMRVRCAA